MGRHWYELTVVTLDKPRLFARIAGVLAAWGMNIVKANAFSDQAGVVVDSFYFTDPYRTLELNLPEWDRFQRSLGDVLREEDSLERLMKSHIHPSREGSVKVKVETRISFDDDASAQSTLLEVIAQDRPGLLYRITSRLAQEKCNIEIALIDTEGQMAIDVFYLTSEGGKLSGPQREKLLQQLAGDLSS
jgi:[protein-PII] uridylyltransferase